MGGNQGSSTYTNIFVNYQDDGSGDYHLVSGSPAINSGTDNNTLACAVSPGINPCIPLTDFSGNTYSSPPPIGAYSFGGSAAPSVCLSAPSLNFGALAVGSPAPTQTVTLTNCGTATLSSISISVTAGGSDYSQTNGCGSSRTAGQACSIVVSFTPSVGGSRAGTITITSNAATQTIALAGSGNTAAPVPNPPTSLNSPSHTASTINLAWTASSTTSPAITNYKLYRGASSGSETLVATLGVVTSYADSTGISLGQTYFYKTTAVNSNGESVLSNEISVFLPFGGAAAAISPTNLTFPPGTLHVTSSPQTVTVSNVGSVDITVVSATPTGDFGTTSDTCTGNVVHPGNNCTLGVTYTPSTSGVETGTLTVITNAS